MVTKCLIFNVSFGENAKRSFHSSSLKQSNRRLNDFFSSQTSTVRSPRRFDEAKSLPIKDSYTLEVVLPFREWKDEEIKEENWNSVRTAPWKFEDPILDRKRRKRRGSIRSAASTKRSPSQQSIRRPEHFIDEQTVYLPGNILAHEWMNAAKLFTGKKLAIYGKGDDYPDLISANKHLLHSNFMRNFISAIHTLTYLGKQTNFSTQFSSDYFKPNINKKPWKPWYHIYSAKYASKPNQHCPTYNKLGKYIVRLYWMGTWRKIYVDDRIPVDISNNILLPSTVLDNVSVEGDKDKKSKKQNKQQKDKASKKDTDSEKSKSSKLSGESKKSKSDKESKKSKNIQTDKASKRVIELWPFLLSKALLKLACLHWSEDKEVVDFDIIQCFTGWIPQRINTKGWPASEIWKICWAYTSHFQWPKDLKDKKALVLTKSTAENEYDEENETAMIEKKLEAYEREEREKRAFISGMRENAIDQIVKKQDKVDTEDAVYHLVAQCNDLRELAEDVVPNFSPCWSNEFLIDETRDIPLKRCIMPEELEGWKRIRWLKWAVKKGIVPDEALIQENFHLKVVTPFAKVDESKQSISKKKKTKDKISPARAKSNVEVSSLGIGRDSNLGVPDVPKSVFWLPNDKLSPHVNTLIIYYKPSKFKTKLKISDSGRDGLWDVKEWDILYYHSQVKISRNEPLYIFSESIDYKFLVLNFSQTGNIFQSKTEMDITSIPPPNIEKDKPVADSQFDICLASLVEKIKANVTQNLSQNDEPLNPLVVSDTTPIERYLSHIVLEEYDWKTDKLGNTVLSLNTYGSKTTSLELKPGRKIMKLWIKSDTPYILYIFSNDPVIVGDLKTILSCMSKESQLLHYMYSKIANSFLELVNAFGTEEFRSQLVQFCDSYKPHESLTKLQSNSLHNTFLNVLLEFVRGCLTNSHEYALNILLLRWQHLLRPDNQEFYNICNCVEEEDLEYLKMLERQVVRIQALFRGAYERSLMKYQDGTHPNFHKIMEDLLNIYTEIFSTENRFTLGSSFIRSFLAHPELENMREKYKCNKDLENVLTLYEISNNVQVKDGQWLLICRQLFWVNSSDPIAVKINLFCNVDRYVVRVVDNDTNGEIRRYTNNVAINQYTKNEKGYTVLCYVRSPNRLNIQYQLILATKKTKETENITLSKLTSDLILFSGMYTPNVNDYVCNYIISLYSASTIFSAYFKTSYPDVKLNLKIYDYQGKLLHQVAGKGDVVLPAIFLEYSKKSVSKDDSIGSILTLSEITRKLGHRKRKYRDTGDAFLDSMDPQQSTNKHSVESLCGFTSLCDGPASRAANGSVLEFKTNVDGASSSRSSNFSTLSPGMKSASTYTVQQVDQGIKTISSNQQPRKDKFRSKIQYRKKRKSRLKADKSETRADESLYTIDIDTTQDEFQRCDSGLSSDSQTADFRRPSLRVRHDQDETQNRTTKSRKHYMQFVSSLSKMSLTYPPRHYHIVVSMEHDSWPLTTNEWSNVDNPVPDRIQQILNPKEVAHNRSSFPSKKYMFHRPAKIAPSERFTNLTFPTPFWTMKAVTNSGGIVYSKNLSRENKFKDIKATWHEQDPSRCKRGHDLRMKFLEQNWMPNPYTHSEDKSVIRDEVALKVLPPLDLSQYMKKDPSEVEEDKRVYKNQAKLARDTKKLKSIIKQAEVQSTNNSRRMNKLAFKQLRDIQTADEWFAGVLSESERIMNTAMQIREDAVKQVKLDSGQV